MPSSGCLSLTTTHWMVYGIHGNTPYFWPTAQPAFSACLAKINLFMFQISYLTNCCPAIDQKHTNLT